MMRAGRLTSGGVLVPTVTCPECGSQLPFSDKAAPGSVFVCPRCRGQVAVPGPDGPRPPASARPADPYASWRRTLWGLCAGGAASVVSLAYGAGTEGTLKGILCLAGGYVFCRAADHFLSSGPQP
jgi:hypothetical protein